MESIKKCFSPWRSLQRLEMEQILQVKVLGRDISAGADLFLPRHRRFGDFPAGSHSWDEKVFKYGWENANSALLEIFADFHNLLEEDTTLNMGMQHSMKLFRAQRNFYISGFAIFLSLVIRRLIILISQQASLIANSEASMRQAQSATAAARSMIGKEDTKKTDGETKVDEEKVKLQDEVKRLEAELKRELKDKEALKSQAESLNREYDRLTGEYSKLQNKNLKAGGDKSD